MGCSGVGLAGGLGSIQSFTLPTRKTRTLSGLTDLLDLNVF